MLDTVSLFDSMELDNADHRIAARRALALAHNRVERNLGRFLRGAQNEDEFVERLALVQEDFGGYVTTASVEVGHEHPEHIAAALKDHYRLAVDKVEFEETPTEKQEAEEEKVAKTASAPQIKPKKAKKALKRMAKAGRTWKQAMPLEGEQGSPLVGQNSQGQYPIQPGDEAHHTCPNCGSMNHQTNPVTGDPECLGCGYSGPPTNPYGGYGPESDLNHRQRDIGPYGGRDAKTALRGVNPLNSDDMSEEPGAETCQNCAQYYNPQKTGWHCPHCGMDAAEGMDFGSHAFGDYDQHVGSNEHQLVTCPACGGEPESVGGKCSKCHNEGKVPNFGDSMVDAVGADIKTADANPNNTDLDGPEPKMDKRLWTPSNPGEPKIEDGDDHPTKDKDVTEVIGPMRNDHELSEIYGEGENHEKQSLPTQTDDTPFASNNMEMAPHTKTFNGDGQVDPVTQQSLEAVQSAYVTALNKESMGMSAQDFRMLADAIRTAPEGADKATLANHVAKYLQGTNPLFDGDRFLQAAMGTPTTQRDTYQLPGEQGGVGLQQNFNADAGSAGAYAANPLSKIIRSRWPSEQSVTAALLS